MTDHEWRFIGVLRKARFLEKEAVFTPPVQREIRSFMSVRTLENLVAPIYMRDHGLTRARVLQFP